MNAIARIAAAALAAAAGLSAIPASAKDWIEAVELRRDGIDLAVIEVAPGAKNYDTIRTKEHTFLLALSARATKGERIAAAQLSSAKSNSYFEYMPEWSRRFQGRDVNSGSKRSWSLSVAQPIALKDLRYAGGNPIQKCNDILAKEIIDGKSRSEALSKTYKTTVEVKLELRAVAARKKHAEKGDIDLGNTTEQRHSMLYPVAVTCLSNPKRVGS